MNKIRCTSLVILAGLFGGCSGVNTPSKADTEFGSTVRQARALQTLNPTAGRDTAVANGDAAALRLAMQRQRDSYKNPPPTFNVIGVTSTSAGE